MSYNNDTTSHPEKQVNLVQIAQEVVHNLLQSYDPTPLPPDADGLFHYIYITWNKDTYKFYVGKHSSKNPATDSYIGSGKHMLRAIEKHGASSFEHHILQYTSTAQEAFDLEGEIVNEGYIKLYRDELQITYNLIAGGGTNGISEETRQKMSEAQKKYREKPEVRQKTSEATKKRFEDNPVELEKLNEASKEYWATPEARKKASETTRKHFENNPEAVEKNRKAVKKFWEENPEARKKQSEANKKRCENPEARKKLGQNARDAQAIKELIDLAGTTKIKVHKDEVLQYLKEGWYLNVIRAVLHNPTTLQQVGVHMHRGGRCYKVVNTPRIIKLLEEGWVIGSVPRN